jgi:hypothetical protein
MFVDSVRRYVGRYYFFAVRVATRAAPADDEHGSLSQAIRLPTAQRAGRKRVGLLRFPAGVHLVLWIESL